MPANRVDVHETQVEGFTHCVNPACADFDVELNIDLVKTTRVDRDSELPIEVNHIDRYHLVDDADLPCPSCEVLRWFGHEKRPEIPNHLAGFLGSSPLPDTPVAPQGLDPEVLAQAFVMAQQMQEQMKAAEESEADDTEEEAA